MFDGERLGHGEGAGHGESAWATAQPRPLESHTLAADVSPDWA